MTANEFISIREFARRVNVHESTVRGHMGNGRFTNGVKYDGNNRPRMAWPEALDEWRAFGGGTERVNRRQRKHNDGEDLDPNLPDIDTSRQKIEYYKAQTAEVEYRVLNGELIDKQEVYNVLFEHGTSIRLALLAIPDQITDDVMAAKTRGEALGIIRSATEKALENLIPSDLFSGRNNVEAA